MLTGWRELEYPHVLVQEKDFSALAVGFHSPPFPLGVPP